MDPQLLARIQAMLGGGQGPQTPFTQPPGTTLNSMGAPAPAPAAMPGQQNPPQPTPLGGQNGVNMGGITKGIGQLASALNPQPAQMSQMQTPNLQPHQMNPQAMQLLMQNRPGSPGGGGPFGETQGYGYG